MRSKSSVTVLSQRISFLQVSANLKGFRVTMKLNVPVVLCSITASHVSARPSSTGARVHLCSIKLWIVCVRATWSNHRVAKALDHPSITRTNEGRLCSQVDKWWHCVHLPHQELVCFMDNAELDTVVPLKNQKPH